MNVLVNVGAYDPIPSRGSVADAPGVHDDLPTKFLIKGAISPQEALNAIEMIVGLRPDTDAKDKANKPLVTWEIKRPKEWWNDRVLIYNLSD